MGAILIDVPVTEPKVNEGHPGIRKHNVLWLEVIVGPPCTMHGFQGFYQVLRQ